MPRLDVMISHNHGIISNLIDHTRIKMHSRRIHEIIIIRCIISLQTVSCIHKNDILTTPLSAQTIHICRDRNKRRSDCRFYIKRIKITSVNIVGGQQMEGILSILRAA